MNSLDKNNKKNSICFELIGLKFLDSSMKELSCQYVKDLVGESL